MHLLNTLIRISRITKVPTGGENDQQPRPGRSSAPALQLSQRPPQQDRRGRHQVVALLREVRGEVGPVGDADGRTPTEGAENAAQGGQVPEVAGDAAILVNPLDPADIADGITRVLTNDDLRRDLRRRGLARARQFSWESSVRRIREIYSQVGESAPAPALAASVPTGASASAPAGHLGPTKAPTE